MGGRESRLTNFEGRDELGEADDQEEQVEEELELVEEHHRNKRQYVVLRVGQLVRGKVVWDRLPLHVQVPLLKTTTYH